ncbi:PDR/VanB family oxidoreductase [Ruegeria marina]|uniref:Vanillate O-demethylase ferredoxin subunit n=1 Tax=Ruegeria marina TaxID=639004 RepID=A0A1G6SKB5_9RHOB|nr:PDR/VanB family oxidoreductase [Ruegeria marina]SDD17380.1 vanillate O-demethylase ferredoxin subunit [Ruegeria marina]
MLDLRIAQKLAVTKRISAFTLVAAGGEPLPTYTPGAHIDVSTPSGPRSYSLIDWPGDTPGSYTIAVQREDEGGGGSRAMHALSEGDRVAATEPGNDFELRSEDKPVALLAGGIGVTPLISMASALRAQARPFVFHYAGRSAEAMAWLDRLSDDFGPGFHAHFDDTAPLDMTALMAGLSGHALYVCGPRGMIEAARAAAEAAGIAPADIHVELFTTAAPAAGDSAFEVEIASTGQVIPVDAGQTIIEALEEAGLDPLYDCQRGDCGICQTGVISGTPDHRDVVLSQAERDSGKVMQICVSRALSARLVLDM